LPSTFDIDIPRPEEVQSPVKLGDYLDEVELSPPPRVKPQRKEDESNVVEMPKPKDLEGGSAQDVSPRKAPKQAPPTEAATSKKRRKKRKGPARKQINASPETLNMIDEVIEHVQTYSVQKDAKASEVFHALVLALYEAREFIDMSEVPARGRWGTPTAKAFPISLKNAFQEAIAAASKKHRR
jgi:hypothetical protein